MSAHTPGPWVVGMQRNKRVFQDGGKFVADCDSAADARLIAAAPPPPPTPTATPLISTVSHVRYSGIEVKPC